MSQRWYCSPAAMQVQPADIMGAPLRIWAVLYTAIGLDRRTGHIGRFDRNSADTVGRGREMTAGGGSVDPD